MSQTKKVPNTDVYTDLLLVVKARLDPDGFAKRDVDLAEKHSFNRCGTIKAAGLYTITDEEGRTWQFEVLENRNNGGTLLNYFIGRAVSPVTHIRRGM